MKNRRLTLLSIAVVLLVSSCRKNDFLAPETAATPDQTTASADWKSAPSWNATEGEGYKSHSFSLVDPRITEEVAASGLVIGFKKIGNSVEVLPAEEKSGAGSYFWYYQVADGAVEVSADAYGSIGAPAADNTFKFIVFTQEELAGLEEKGYPVSRLMQLSYSELSAL